MISLYTQIIVLSIIRHFTINTYLQNMYTNSF